MSLFLSSLILFVFGLAFGSFFNVLIYRLPRDLSIVKPGSFCPSCEKPIKWYDNIPILSYCLLRGKCRNCGAKISLKYPLVELAGGIIFAGTPILAKLTGFSRVPGEEVTSPHIAVAIIFLSILFLTLMIDLEWQIIPDQLNIALFILALISVFLLKPSFSPSYVSSLIGMFVLAGFFFLLAVLIGGMGMGDVKMAVGLGFLFGWQMTLVIAFLSFLIGGIYAIFLLLRLIIVRKYKPRIAIAFGPYLAIASAITLFAGEKLLNWYLGFFKTAG